MENWTEPIDIVKRWINMDKPLPDDETVKVFIDDFEMQILAKYPRIQERIDDGLISVELIKRVVAGWTIEFLQSGGTPYSSETQTYTGIMSRSISMSNSARTSTSLSIKDLDALAPDSRAKIFSVNMVPHLNRRRRRNSTIEYINGWDDC